MPARCCVYIGGLCEDGCQPHVRGCWPPSIVMKAEDPEVFVIPTRGQLQEKEKIGKFVTCKQQAPLRRFRFQEVPPGDDQKDDPGRQIWRFRAEMWRNRQDRGIDNTNRKETFWIGPHSRVDPPPMKTRTWSAVVIVASAIAAASPADQQTGRTTNTTVWRAKRARTHLAARSCANEMMRWAPMGKEMTDPPGQYSCRAKGDRADEEEAIRIALGQVYYGTTDDDGRFAWRRRAELYVWVDARTGPREPYYPVGHGAGGMARGGGGWLADPPLQSKFVEPC